MKNAQDKLIDTIVDTIRTEELISYSMAESIAEDLVARIIESEWGPMWLPIPKHETYEVNREGQVRNRNTKRLITRMPNGFYKMTYKGSRVLWCEGEIGTQNQWEEFWNGTHPIFKESS